MAQEISAPHIVKPLVFTHALQCSFQWRTVDTEVRLISGFEMGTGQKGTLSIFERTPLLAL